MGSIKNEKLIPERKEGIIAGTKRGGISAQVKEQEEMLIVIEEAEDMGAGARVLIDLVMIHSVSKKII